MSHIGVWAELSNPMFNCIEFDAIGNDAGAYDLPRTIKAAQTYIIGKEQKYNIIPFVDVKNEPSPPDDKQRDI